MAATVTVMSWNAGSAGVPTIAAVPAGPPNVRLKDADSNVVDAANPVVIAGAIKFNFWKHIALQIAAGGYTQIDNLRHSFASNTWTLGTAGELRRGARDTGDIGCPEASYAVADGLNDIDAVAPAGHEFYTLQTPAFIAVDGGETDILLDSTVYTSGTANDTFAIVFQVKVDTDAVAGDQTDITNTFKWDEI